MKKSALLAVSALSLGVVGLSTFTPVVGAAAEASNATATVTVTVPAGLGIGTGNTSDINYGDQNVSALDVDFGQVKPGGTSTRDVTVKTVNNTGSAAVLNLKAGENGPNLKNNSETIAYSTSAVTTTAPGWNAATSGSILDITGGKSAKIYDHSATETDNTKTQAVNFKIVVPSSTKTGSYSTTVVYSFTQ